MLAILSVLVPAEAAPPEQTTAPTVEGDTLVVEKKGRGDYKVLIEADGKGDDITCTLFVVTLNTAMLRAPFAAQLKAAGERAKNTTQVGNVIPFDHSGLGAGSYQFMPGVCALGLDVVPGSVMLTLATMSKMNGRTATLTPDDAIRIGSWLLE